MREQMITARRAWLYLAVTFAVTFFVASGPIAAQAAPAGTNSVKDWRAQVDALCTESNAAITQAYRAVTIGSDGEPLPAEFSTFMVTQLQPNFSQLVAAIKTTPAPKKIRPKVKMMVKKLNKTTLFISPTITKEEFLKSLTPAGQAAVGLGLTVCAQ